jgi:tetratricopeptide (TPR) repeat protein
MFTLARNLCTYRIVDAVRAVGPVDPGFELPLGAVEQSIRAAMVRADESFYGGRYALALQSYQGAYAEIYRYLHPDLPSRFMMGALDRVARIDVLDGLLSASAELARFRRVAGVDAALASPRPAPPELIAIVSEAGVAPTMAESLYQRATIYMRAGVADRAQMFLEQASATADATPKLRADITLAIGVALMQRDQNRAIDSFRQAQERYRRLGLGAEEAVASNNLAVLHTLATPKRRARRFAPRAIASPSASRARSCSRSIRGSRPRSSARWAPKAFGRFCRMSTRSRPGRASIQRGRPSLATCV